MASEDKGNLSNQPTAAIMVGLGTLVVAILAMVAFRVHQLWNPREGRLFNWFMILHGPVSAAPLFGLKSVQEQVAFLDSVTARSETPVPFPKFIFGQDLASAIQGPNASVSAELHIPSRDQGRTIPVLCARPAGSQATQLPIILYFHSGGLILNSPKVETVLILNLAKKANTVVCALNYRKPPQYPYPATTNDVVDFALYFLQQGVHNTTQNLLFQALGVTIDPTQVATFGTSAGGYLSAIASRLLTVQHNLSIQLQVSLMPMAKPHGGTLSILRNVETDMWDRHWNAYAWSVYLPNDDGTLAHDWRVNLLVDPPNASDNDNDNDNHSDDKTSKLPPVYLQINTRDILYDEGRMYKERLQQQNKLLHFVQVDTNHIGGSPPFSNGGPAEGSFQRAADFVGSFFSQARKK